MLDSVATSKNTIFNIPLSLTTVALVITPFFEPTTCIDLEKLPCYPIYRNEWEIQYEPSIELNKDSEIIEIINTFAINLIQNSENIPEDFAKVINEDFWKII
jgi:hypothetical protein